MARVATPRMDIHFFMVVPPANRATTLPANGQEGGEKGTVFKGHGTLQPLTVK
ncbi:hypothetical protein DC3_47450 [Deinococcus cellulosilyticus NBRC 106333 = KACC 11606]|uniref:Uncharacterized protein n=1 Tax=Deinococcus cellulosilyticus (strain DSM 18568 / NBRC 106333 / KACC 11606 / 5516J-15) TaxID=1223518 RepID=A0A511N8F8_DEIC1|nr:hypothetical protein DC3_47450 [Deinococcus cellulosilyticus NBRC 106333 = KACC 11606]